MSERQKTKQNIRLVTLTVFLIGVVGVLAVGWFVESAMPRPGSILYAFAAGLTTLSVSMIGFALFQFALETKNWRDYFSDRVKEVVIEKDYLKSLDDRTLKELQTSVLKAQFKNPNIDKEGSFLHYFHNNLHKFISEPYREDVSTEILIVGESPDGYTMKDKIVYTCRSFGSSIQSNIAWAPDEGEFVRVNALKASIQYPQSHEKSGEREILFPVSEDDKVKDLNGRTEVSLEKYASIDGLIVTIEAEYVMKRGQLQSWQMAHPTKNFDLTIQYPAGASIQFKSLFLAEYVSKTAEAGFVRLKFDTWLLPQSGIAWVVN